MNERFELEENEIRKVAASFRYPATPDVALSVRQQIQATPSRKRRPFYVNRLAWVVVLVILFVVTLWSVPQVRAAFLRMFNIGAITIFELEDSRELVPETAVLSATKPVPDLLVPVEYALEVSLTEVKSRLADSRSSLYLPADLTEPDAVYWVDPRYQMTPTVISIWEDEGLALYQIGVPQFGMKGAHGLENTAVNGQQAFWLDMPHPFRLQNEPVDEWQYVPGHVLIWWHDDGITFRLEGADSKEDAVRLAETLAKTEE